MSGLVEPVTLTGEQWVSLEPLRSDHVPELAEVVSDGELGRLWFTVVYSILDIEWPSVRNNLRYRLARQA